MDVMAVSNDSVPNVTEPIIELLEDQQHMDLSALHDTTSEQIRRVRYLVGWLHTHVENLTSDPSQIKQPNHVETNVIRRLQIYERNFEEALRKRRIQRTWSCSDTLF